MFGSWNFPPSAWPGGCLVEIAGRREGDGWIASTFGLTNPALTQDVPGRAEHGFELLACTRTRTDASLRLLRAAATHILLTGFSFLDEVARFGGSSINRDRLVVPGFSRIPRDGVLPNGGFQYLVVLPISPQEYAFIQLRPMAESLPELLATRRDEWSDERAWVGA